MMKKFTPLFALLLSLMLLTSSAGCGMAADDTKSSTIGETGTGSVAITTEISTETVADEPKDSFTDTSKKFYCKPEKSFVIYKGDDYQIYVTSLEIIKKSARTQVQVTVDGLYRSADAEGRIFDIKLSSAAINGIQSVNDPYLSRWLTVKNNYQTGGGLLYLNPWDDSLYEKCTDIELTFDIRNSETQQLVNTVNWHYTPYGDAAAVDGMKPFHDLESKGKTLIDTDTLKVVSLGYTDATAFNGYSSKLLFINKTASRIYVNALWKGADLAGEKDSFYIEGENGYLQLCPFAAKTFDDMKSEQLTCCVPSISRLNTIHIRSNLRSTGVRVFFILPIRITSAIRYTFSVRVRSLNFRCAILTQ